MYFHFKTRKSWLLEKLTYWPFTALSIPLFFFFNLEYINFSNDYVPTNDTYKTAAYHYNQKYADWQAWANCVDPDQMLQNAASDQGLHCLPLIHQFLHTPTGSEIDLGQILGQVW